MKSLLGMRTLVLLKSVGDGETCSQVLSLMPLDDESLLRGWSFAGQSPEASNSQPSSRNVEETSGLWCRQEASSGDPLPRYHNQGLVAPVSNLCNLKI